MTALLTRKLADVCDRIERDARAENPGDDSDDPRGGYPQVANCVLCRKPLDVTDTTDRTGLAHLTCSDAELRDCGIEPTAADWADYEANVPAGPLVEVPF